MDKITDSYIDSILHNSECTETFSGTTYSMIVVCPNGFIVSSVFPFFAQPDENATRKAREHCLEEIRCRIREYETYHLLSIQNRN